MACSTASSLPEHLEVRSCGRHMVRYVCSCYGRKPLQRCAVQENRGERQPLTSSLMGKCL